MEISLATDSDGFLSQECPACSQRFKVLFGQGSSDPISYCPYCRYRGEDCWHTSEQVEYFHQIAMHNVVGPSLRDLARKSKGLFKVSSSRSSPPSPPIDEDIPLTPYLFACCGETVKLGNQAHYFCIICGSEIDMEHSRSKRIFLSHKGIDKSEVKKYKKTLELLNYQPWIDEDDIVAGESLDRSLLSAMKDSCAVVFFVTPHFKDEEYLQSEINFAVQQKREKKDKFAIITLQFIDKDGNEGVIPDLLKQYVWKQPKNSLEALQEIVRALPVCPTVVDWRDNIENVARTPVMKSTSVELSKEATEILRAAVDGTGRIQHTTSLSTESIATSGRELLPDQNARTLAIWKGGLTDLRQRGFIRDVGSKGQIFEVTREGYAYVDWLDQTP